MALLTGLIGLSGLGVAAVGPEQRVLGLVIGVFMLSVTWLLLVSARSARSAWSSTTLAGRPAWSVPVGGSRGSAPAAATVCTVLGAGFLLGAFVADSTGVTVLSGALALFMLVLGAEMWRSFLLKPELRISADLVQLHGAGIDSELGWDDVGVVEHAHLGTRWAALVLTAAVDAPSYRQRVSRFLLPTDRVPDPPGVHLRVGLIPDEPRLRRLLQAMHAGGRSTREAMIGRGLPDASGY